MARCSHSDCRRWRPDTLIRYTRSGLTVDGAWFCSASCVESSTQQRLLDVKRTSTPVPAIPALRLGVLLLHQGVITSENLTQALESQRATRLLTGCTPEPLLVTDSDLAALMHSYGASAPAPHRRVGFVNAHDVNAAAAHIAAVAKNEGAVTLTEAHSDWATWVRIESVGAVDTLFMRYEESLECPVAITLH